MEGLLWPGKCKSAAMFTFDLDGETIWDNANASLPNGGKYIKSVSLGRYGPKRSVPLILDMMDKYNLKCTFFIPGVTAERYPDLVRTIHDAGHEVAHHGYAHELFADKTVEQQIEIIEKTQNLFREIIGRPARGFRAPSGDWTVETPSLLFQRGIDYSSSMCGDDRPYRTIIDGVETDFVEMPSKWEQDDYVQMAYSMYPPRPGGQDRISCYRNVLDNFTREFEGSHELGLLVVYMFHPQVIGTPGRMSILESLIKRTLRDGDVWVARGDEVADWYRKTYPIGVGAR